MALNGIAMGSIDNGKCNFCVYMHKHIIHNTLAMIHKIIVTKSILSCLSRQISGFIVFALQAPML